MKRTMLLSVLLLSLTVQLVWAQDPNESHYELIFETLLNRPYDRSVVAEANYVVELRLPPRSILYVPESLEQWSGHQEFSEDQQRLIKLYPGRISPNHYGTEGYSVYHILAVSEEDVHLLVSSLLKSDVQLITQELEDFKAEKAQNDERLKKQETRLPQLEQELKKWQKTIPEAIAAYKGNISCVFENSDEPSALSHALKNADDVSVHIREVEFELIGLDAKQAAIEANVAHLIKEQKLAQELGRLPFISERQQELERLLITLEIERAGALARKAAYEQTFNQAKAVIEAINTKEQCLRDITLCKESITALQGQVRLLGLRIDGLTLTIQNTRPLKIQDNKVFIRPVAH